MFLNGKLTLKERTLISQSLNTDNMSTMSALVKRALIYTLVVQIIGMIVFSFTFIHEFGLGQGIFKALFTSISAFCNAGFDIVGFENYSAFQTLPSVNITIMVLSIVGGIGFIVFDDVYLKVKMGIRNNYSFPKIISSFAIHTKLVFIVIAILIIIGFGYIILTEYNNQYTIANLELQDKMLVSSFYSITSRSVGFSTFDVMLFTDACKIGIILLMLIGGAPGGTAGGIKVTTLAVIFISIVSFIKGKKHVKIFSREISMQTIIKAYVILMLYLVVITVSVIILSITDNNNILNLIIESVSAIGNVGLSTGLVSDFSSIGKIDIMILMYLGRVGTITMALAFLIYKPKITENIRYPEEKIIVG